jgi:hypothetical protein
MTTDLLRLRLAVSLLVLTALTACSATRPLSARAEPAAPVSTADFERDRAAILGMAGEFDVTFEFTETVALRNGYQLQPPKRSRGTELVEVIEDSGRRIVLQHILVLGEEHTVVKHWRQDWTYEDGEVWAFRGRGLWERQRYTQPEVRGTWSQAVYEVDDCPRYESIGRWQHDAGSSTWASGETWRPLPRREYTKRNDYNVIVAINRHVVTPQGWRHEQDNSKLDLDDATGEPLLAREVGLNTYKRVAGYDFSAGREYWKRTSAFWADVRQDWASRMQVTDRFVVNLPADGHRLYDQLLPLAEEPDVVANADRRRSEIRRLIDGFVSVSHATATAALNPRN